MDFDKAIHLLNTALTEKNPESFSGTWVHTHAPRAYRFIRLCVRTPGGGIDWDFITGELDPPFQKRWTQRQRKRRMLLKLYENQTEVDAIKKKHQDKLYTFIAPATAEDRVARDRISIALLRIAQKGNITAQQELTELLTFTIENWTERYWYFSRWRYHSDRIHTHIETCMRRYRFTGSFIKYLFISLLYSARGLPPIKVFSLDRPIYADDETTWAERVVQDAETGEIRMYEKS